MGSCLFRPPVSDVDQNPSVTSCTAVDHIVVVRPWYSRKARAGLIYVKGDRLHYESAFNFRRCSCLRQSLPLANIVKVKTYQNKYFVLGVGCCDAINLCPGLRISFQSPDIVWLVDMPEAVTFASQLDTTRTSQWREREATERNENLERRTRERAAKNVELKQETAI